MGEVLACEADLEAVVGGRPAPMLLKSIRFLDDHCERFLARSTFAVLGTTTSGGSLQAIAPGGAPGALAPRSDTTLELGRAPSGDVIDGAPAGLVALVPGYGEMLRINGRLEVQGDLAFLHVDEALLHCAKATIRSELWSPPASAAPIDGAAPPALGEFLAGSPFVVLVSTDSGGHADASPKGDPEGLGAGSTTPRSPSPTAPGTGGPTRSTT